MWCSLGFQCVPSAFPSPQTEQGSRLFPMQTLKAIIGWRLRGGGVGRCLLISISLHGIISHLVLFGILWRRYHCWGEILYTQWYKEVKLLLLFGGNREPGYDFALLLCVLTFRAWFCLKIFPVWKTCIESEKVKLWWMGDCFWHGIRKHMIPPPLTAPSTCIALGACKGDSWQEASQ